MITSIPSSFSQQRAREIMGKNFFGIEEASRIFMVNPSKEQTAALADIPFSEEILAACRDTHVFVAVFPITIVDIEVRVGDKLFYAYEDPWFDMQIFARERGRVGWHLVRKTPVENSTLKEWTAQQALLSNNEMTPTARLMVYTIIGHFLITGERLFQNIYVRCSDKQDSTGYRARVGHFTSEGLHVRPCWDDSQKDYIGLASILKCCSKE